jgi:hypothetical protein
MLITVLKNKKEQTQVYHLGNFRIQEILVDMIKNTSNFNYQALDGLVKDFEKVLKTYKDAC